jgi:ELWxxDGT repeat protein
VPIVVNVGPELKVAGGTLFVSSNSSSLWRSDGTAGGTVLLRNFPGSVLRNFTELNSKLFFTVNEDLWQSDGTTNGTIRVADFPPAASEVEIRDLKTFLGALVFTANTITYGREWWTTAPDQTATQIQDLSPLSGSPGISFASAGTNKVFYMARPGGQPNWQVRALQLNSLSPPPRGPWNGVLATAPGMFEAEDFDIGGEGAAYHDNGIVNEGGYDRVTEAVDIKPSTDTNGGFVVTLTHPGEWLEYTFNATFPAVYRLEARVAGAPGGGSFQALLDGSITTGTINVPNTGGVWTNANCGTFAVNTGLHVLRLTCITTNAMGTAGDFNWLRWNFFVSNSPPFITLTAPVPNAIYSTNSGVVLAATVTDATSNPSPVTDFFVDGQIVGSDSNSPYRFTWAATPGAHTVYARATDSFGTTGVTATRTFFVSEPEFDLNATWRYYDAGTLAGTTWRDVGFNDSTWLSGGAQLGFGDGDETTLLASGTGHSPITTYYFRRSFELRGVGSNTYASITLLRDDAAVVYVNGTETERLNLPKGTIAYTNLAITNIDNVLIGSDQAIDTFTVPRSLLVNGDNVIAVEVHQGTGTGAEFDISFALAFSMFNYSPPLALRIQSAGTNAVISWPDDQQTWRLERTLDFNSWSPATNAIVRTNGTYSRVEPMANQGFFRLRLMQ